MGQWLGMWGSLDRLLTYFIQPRNLSNLEHLNLSSTMSLPVVPAGKVSGFERWFLANSRQMSSVENAARSLTLFAPGQNNDVEIISEGAAAVLQLLSLYHDQLSARALSAELPERELTPHGKYIASLVSANPGYKYSAYGLGVLRSSELLIEMVARDRGGQNGRWKAVLGLESVKAALRLVMLATSQRPLATPFLHDKELDPESLSQIFSEENPAADENDNENDIEKSPSEMEESFVHITEESVDGAVAEATTVDSLITRKDHSHDPAWTMPRTGKFLEPSPLDVPSLLQSRVLKPESLRKPFDLVRKFVPLSLAGEVAGILRPLIYAVLAYRYRFALNRRGASWTPWIVGVLVEFISRKLSSDALASLPGGRRNLSAVEQANLRAKTSSMWWWLLRGPMYRERTRPLIAGFANKFSNIPLLNIFTILVNDYLYLLDTYYFASASY